MGAHFSLVVLQDATVWYIGRHPAHITCDTLSTSLMFWLLAGQ